MAKTDDTIENRVYLFESLASSYVAAAAEMLSSDDEQTRQRATRALAELAYVSCVVADTQHLTPEQVRERVLGSFEPEPPPEAPRGKGGKRR